MRSGKNIKPCFFSPRALSHPELPVPVRKLGRELSNSRGSAAFRAPLVVAFASELVQRRVRLPEWTAGASTRYLVVLDVPDPVLLRIASALDLRRPEQRVHATRDRGVVRRLIISTARREPFLGIVDAYLWDESLNLVTGDFEFRSVPIDHVPRVAELTSEEQGKFEISVDGSHLFWPARDLHLGVSQVLQEVDPMYLADIAIERNRQDHTGAALRSVREEKHLRQADIQGLSERQVRRIEEGISRLRVATAEKFAGAFGMDLPSLLDEIARRAGAIRQSRQSSRAEGDTPRAPPRVPRDKRV